MLSKKANKKPKITQIQNINKKTQKHPSRALPRTPATFNPRHGLRAWAGTVSEAETVPPKTDTDQLREASHCAVSLLTFPLSLLVKMKKTLYSRVLTTVTSQKEKQNPITTGVFMDSASP